MVEIKHTTRFRAPTRFRTPRSLENKCVNLNQGWLRTLRSLYIQPCPFIQAVVANHLTPKGTLHYKVYYSPNMDRQEILGDLNCTTRQIHLALERHYNFQKHIFTQHLIHSRIGAKIPFWDNRWCSNNPL